MERDPAAPGWDGYACAPWRWMRPGEAELILQARFEHAFTHHHRRFHKGVARERTGVTDPLAHFARIRGYHGDRPILALLDMEPVFSGTVSVPAACELLDMTWCMWKG